MLFIKFSGVKIGYGFWAATAAPRPISSNTPTGTVRIRTETSLAFENITQLTRAIAEFFNGNAEGIQYRQMQVRERSTLRLPDITASLKPGCLSTDQCDRQIVVEM